MAVHAHTTSFDLAAILKDAWLRYWTARPAIYAAGDIGLKRTFLPILFAKMLRHAWADAKKAARAIETTAAAFIEAQRNAQAVRVAAMDSMTRSARIVEIRFQLQLLDYAPLGIRTSRRRHDLGAELAMLAGGADVAPRATA
ncbi:hypothetical protein PRN20_04460 [Devosia sp. ZB163]|uniref:hypothetical protein n=1 Tax=Devosia sp. ZB163 TaxID=3025938 RepID=UPI00236312C3|nr:hypothetical protein [Devosia sp. ZB163]MDC9822974.1 hypothetical protein [Devosia sp. ZB163]